MSIFCIHEWKKLADKPLYDYWDYSGIHVGVFKCQCGKCGRIRKKKFCQFVKGTLGVNDMASENKKRKGKNAFISNLGLKSKKKGIKKLDFYTASDRQKNKVSIDLVT